MAKEVKIKTNKEVKTKAKEVKIKVEGKVLSESHGVYEVELPNKATINARISGKMRMNIIRILPGDIVVVEMSPYDLDLKCGLIVYRK